MVVLRMANFMHSHVFALAFLVRNSQFCSEKGVPDLRLPKNRLGYMMCADDVFVCA